MQLPKSILPYFVAKLWANNSTTTHLSRMVNKSHDFLTRALKNVFSWKTYLRIFLKGIDLKDGYFVFDETEINKSFAKKIFGLGWIYSHLEGKYILGLQIVVIAWTNGKKTIPLAWKIYRKKSKENKDLRHKTKVDLAMELLKYCIAEICSKPKGVLFDSFYSAEKLLKLVVENKLKFYAQVEKTRTLNHLQIQYHNKGRPRWTKSGLIKGNIYVRITKHDRKYFLTNDLRVTGKELRDIYSLRWEIEDLYRFCKDQLDLEGCQMRDLRSQTNHIGVCFFLHCVLQDIAEKTQMTKYKVKEELFIERSLVNCPYFTTYFETA